MTVQCRPSKADALMRVLGRSDCAGAGRRCARGFDRDPVDGLVVGGGGQPGPGFGGYAVGRPPLDGGRERLSRRLLDVDLALKLATEASKVCDRKIEVRPFQ